MNLNIFDLLYPSYKITKPIRLITLFSGYDSQALALKYLGVEFEHWKTCEWAIKSIQALNDLHFQDYNDYSASFEIDFIKDYLLNKGVSQNYNEPLNKKQIDKMSEQYARKIFNNIIATRNLVNIQQAKGKDFEIKDTDKFTYLLTYSFPCQDLSLAGKGKGMSDTSTRSGMLWEVERILGECYEFGSLPEVLLMENVPQVHGEGNLKDFQKWQLRLEELGYKNYMKDLIATDYGIPQTRNRCFMVSILGDYNYSFPKPTPLKIKLKNLLEDNVDEKYYLSDKFLKCMMVESSGGYPRKERFEQSLCRVNEQDVANTITTLEGNRDISTFIKIKNATEKGYLEAEDNDTQYHQQNRIYDNNSSISVTTSFNPYYPDNNLRIRKLTPKECFRLMGVKDEDFEKVAKNQSNASLYHLAGDSIVVNVLMAIFGEML